MDACERHRTRAGAKEEIGATVNSGIRLGGFVFCAYCASCGSMAHSRGAGSNCPHDLCASRCSDLNSDPRNCGSCAHDCAALAGIRPDAVRCEMGVCALAICSSRWRRASGRGACPSRASLMSPLPPPGPDASRSALRWRGVALRSNRGRQPTALQARYHVPLTPRLQRARSCP